MNQATTRQYDEFVFRRLTEPFPLVGNHLEPRGNTILWLAVLFTILFVGLIYVGIMYLRDSRGVGIIWAGLLGLLRLGVYAAIAFVFLLPSKQSYEETSASSRVVVLFDVSDSMSTRDDIPRPGQNFDELPTRGKKLQDFLEDSRIDFFGNLIKKNPVVVYRFSAGLDGSPVYFDNDGRTYTKEEYTELEEKRKLPGFQKETEPRPLGHDYLTHFINPITDPNAKPATVPDDINTSDKDRFEKLLAHNRKLAQNNVFKGTNVGDATLNTLTREVNNMAQGIVIFTDGRSTEGTDAAYEQIAKLAKSANIPIFVVGIGSVRPQVRIDITDFRAPQQVQPEDKFRVVAEVTGEGLADQAFAPELHIVYSRKKEDGKEERYKIYVMEQEDKKNPKKPEDRVRIDLGEEIVLKPEGPVKFDTSSPPRAEIEFVIDAAALAKANNPPIDLVGDPQYKGKKWEIGETKEGDVSNPSALHFQLTVPKNNLELFADKLHKSDLLDLRVLKRPLRVLLFASAATHDFQFLNNMMLREVEQQRAELSVYVQPPPGKNPEEWFKTVVLGVKPDHLLLHFPTRYDQPVDDPKERIYDLNEYDVIVAFDPDWSKLTDDQLKLVNTWCSKGGGLVLVGGPINTLQLARPGPNKVKLQPVLDLLPVVLADVRINALDRNPVEPWPLTWGDAANNELEFLRLTEEGDQENVSFKEGWNQFFYGNKEGTGPVKRGFFNYYPTELVKSGSLVVARFGDPKSKMKDGSQMPWLVLNAAGSQHRVVWIAWGETRRLRQHSEAYYERFWIKMLRYAGAHNQTDLVRRIRLDMSRTYTAGRYVQIDAKIDDRGGQPLAPKHDRDMPNIILKLPAGSAPDEIKVPMVAKKVRDDSDRGRFSARFQVKVPGDYKLELKVPETGDSIIQKFNVKESNPELDNTRPDFDQMYRLASDAEQVFARIPVEADRQEVKRNLLPPKLEDKNAKDDILKDGKPRLYFTLENARLIPSCMVTKTDTKQIRGPYKDVWDFGLRKDDHDPLFFFFNVLALIVGLLSVEWLIRKLLRLA